MTDDLVCPICKQKAKPLPDTVLTIGFDSPEAWQISRFDYRQSYCYSLECFGGEVGEGIEADEGTRTRRGYSNNQ